MECHSHDDICRGADIRLRNPFRWFLSHSCPGNDVCARSDVTSGLKNVE